jgi:hypothetical protein
VVGGGGVTPSENVEKKRKGEIEKGKGKIENL